VNEANVALREKKRPSSRRLRFLVLVGCEARDYRVYEERTPRACRLARSGAESVYDDAMSHERTTEPRHLAVCPLH